MKAPAPPERTLRWDGCVNVRDLGGLPLAGGGETAYRVVVRPDSLPGLTEAGRHRSELAAALTALDAAEPPVAIHCAGGRDRTGIACGMALWLAGVSPDAIAADHALSDASWELFNEEWLAEAPDEHERERRRRISQPAGHVLADVLEEIEEREGVRRLLLAAGAEDAALDRIDPSWELTLVDQSPGMVGAARAVLGDRADYGVGDVQELPFVDNCFDIVMAHHMLYHVPDRPRAFAELRRVLVSGGTFYAATNGRGHLQEMGELAAAWWPVERHVDAFGLESGPPQLQPFFVDIRVERLETGLEVTEVEPVLAFLRSSERYDGRDLAEERAAIEAAIERDGVFRVTTTPGLISCPNH